AIAAPFPEAGTDETPDELPCDSYQVTPPETTEDLIRIGEVTAFPGQAVEIPVYLTNSVEVEAFQLVIRYDPSLFTPSKEKPNFTGTPWEQSFEGIRGLAAARAYPEEGLFIVGILGSLTGDDN